MRSFYLLLCCLFGGAFAVSAQSDNDAPAAIRPANIGFGFNFYDFTTAQRIRQNSLSSTINNDQLAEISDMAPGLSIVYAKGLRPQIDFAASLGIGSGRVFLQNKPNQVRNTSFASADVAVQLKLLPERFVFLPYVSAGIGATVTEGFYGATMPLGVGMRFRISDGTSIGLQSQYRVAVTETAGYHFQHGLTIMGKL